MTIPATMPIVKMGIKHENDIVFMRQRVRQIASLVGFDTQDQTRIATTVSELGRNAYQYAQGGMASVSLNTSDDKQCLSITVSDNGPGIAELELVLSGRYVSKTGMGIGLIGARRLMDRVDIQSRLGVGTQVTVDKFLPYGGKTIQSKDIVAIANQLGQFSAQTPFQELQGQNQELLIAMADLSEKKAELAELNTELENTNRGVVALYAELDEHAARLKRVSETKTSFLSNMTHEFRTPVNSILNISGFLLDPEDGVTDPEHKKQVDFIRRSASALSELVNDLLDLSKVEAGKVELRPAKVQVSEIFGTVRGLMKPLQESTKNVSLEFSGFEEIELFVDEGKLNQVLRNLVSNALKYTAEGEVRLTVSEDTPGWVSFKVIDTGIGITPDNLERVFEEFSQIDSLLQRKVKGTGLGLSLSRRLTALLGGTLTVESVFGQGSCFEVRIPKYFVGASEGIYISPQVHAQPNVSVVSANQPLQNLVLIIDDDEAARYTLAKILGEAGVPTLMAENGTRGIALAKSNLPKLIFLDLVMPDLSGYDVMKQLMSDEQTRSIPVVISSSQDLSEEELNYLKDVTFDFIPKNKVMTEQDRIRSLAAKAGLNNAK